MFYVYVLAFPGEPPRPFYVGKGKGRRMYQHDAEARRGCRCHRCNVIRKIWRDGGQVVRAVMMETDSERVALDYEIALIAFYGRDTLTNKTDGGEGVSGFVFSAEQRARLSVAHAHQRIPISQRAAYLARLHSADSKARKAAAMRRPEVRAKLAALVKGTRYSPERRAQQAAILNRPAVRAKAAASHGTPEYAAKLSARTRTPETRRKLSEAARNASAETRARQSAAAKARATTPEGKAHLKAARAKQVISEETRAKIAASMRAYRAKQRD